MRERVLITVKTYPTLSKSYGELVCTAGVREDGSWVRLYPVPFRRLEDYDKHYKKYQWITADLIPRKGDIRPESFAPVLDTLEPCDVITTGKNREWSARKELILQKGHVFDDLDLLITKAHENELSLATFKPAEVLDLVIKETDRQWDPKRLEEIYGLLKQPELFDDGQLLKEQFKIVDKLPYEFSYRFRDAKGRESTLMIIDWEIGMLYWNCLKRTDGDEQIALEKVRLKYYDEFVRTDLHLFLGTTKQFHSWGSNPFVVIGTFTPPKTSQMELPF